MPAVVLALPWIAGAIASATETAVVLGTAAYAGNVAGKLANSGIKHIKQNAPYWADTAGHLLNAGAEDFKVGATAVGLALQESANVTSAYLRSLGNTARIAPPMSFAQAAEFSPTIPFQKTLTASSSYVSGTTIAKDIALAKNYTRRLVVNPTTLPTPADPATATLQKPVVSVNQAVKAKSWGAGVHVPLTTEPVRIQNLNLDEALAQIPLLSQQSATDLSKWIASEHGEESLVNYKPNLLNLSVAYLPASFKIGAFAYGVQSLDALAELYRTASDQATINQATIGISSEFIVESVSVPLPSAASLENPLNLKLTNAGTVVQVKNAIVFPQAVETNVEDLLAHIGGQALTTAGATELINGLDFAPPSREQYAVSSNVLNGENILETENTIKAKTVFELGLATSALTYYRQGLHEFPMQAVNPTEVTKKVNPAEAVPVTIPNVATLQAYNHTVTDKKIGNFPLEIEVKDENGEAVNFSLAEDTLAAALVGDYPATEVAENGNLLLTSLAAVTALGGTLGLQQSKNQGINFNLLTSLSSLTAGAAAVATKAAGCACANADFLGNRSSPICTPVDLPINPGIAGKNPKVNPQPLQKGNAGNVLANFLGGSQGCFPSQLNEEVETVLDLLRDIKYACGLMKQAVLKTPKDIEREKDALEKMTKGIKKTNKERWEKFKDAIKKEESVLNKNYPVKPKLVEYNPDGSPKT